MDGRVLASIIYSEDDKKDEEIAEFIGRIFIKMQCSSLEIVTEKLFLGGSTVKQTWVVKEININKKYWKKDEVSENEAKKD